VTRGQIKPLRAVSTFAPPKNRRHDNTVESGGPLAALFDELLITMRVLSERVKTILVITSAIGSDNYPSIPALARVISRFLS